MFRMLSVYSLVALQTIAWPQEQRVTYLTVFLFMTLPTLFVEPVLRVESFLNVLHDPGFLSGGFGFS